MVGHVVEETFPFLREAGEWGEIDVCRLGVEALHDAKPRLGKSWQELGRPEGWRPLDREDDGTV
jgi:hypothetical protein